MSTIAPCTAQRNGHTAPAVLPQGPALLPEAACSLNVFVDTPAGRIQATARGEHEAETITRLASLVDGIKLQFCAPPPPPSREARLAQLLAKGLTSAVNKGDTTLIERLSKAAALVLAGAVEPTDTPAVLAVRSQTSRDHWYEVTMQGLVCTCPDWAKHHQADDTQHYLCKHGLAVAMLARLDAQDHKAGL